MVCRSTDYQRVSDVISQLFGYVVQITAVTHAEHGVNKDTHFIAATSANEKFGLKLFSKTGSDLGAEKDKLMADIAISIGMPNACQVERSPNLGFIEEFSGSTVSVTKWLPKSRSLKEIDSTERWIEIIDSANEFHYQAGQWMAFGYAFGIADRGNGNWVWQHSEKKLTMIDMEFALNTPSLSDFNELLGRYLTKPRKDTRRLQLHCIKVGFFKGWDLLHDRVDRIRERLSQEEFSRIYVMPLSEDPATIIEPHLKNYEV